MGLTQLSPSSQGQGSPSAIHQTPGEGVEPLLCSECFSTLGSVPEHCSLSRAAETSLLIFFHFSFALGRALYARRLDRLTEDLANLRMAAFHPPLSVLGCLAQSEEVSVVLLRAGQRGQRGRGCQLCAALRLLGLAGSWPLALCAAGLLCEHSCLLAGSS